jgi:hypothetical protein
VNQAPAITSASSTAFSVGALGTFTVTATGVPSPALTVTGTLPTGVTFVDNGNGTGTLSGTPAAGAGGTYAITFTPANAVATGAAQAFTLTVNQAPTFTSATQTTFTTGQAGSFTITTAGFPAGAAMTITQTGALPAGVTFTDNNNGTATLSGTPHVGTGGAYPITLTASNGVAPDTTQAFTLTVHEAPAVTSAARTTFTVGTAGTFTMTTSGFPRPTIARGGAALPGGVTFVDNGDGTGTLSGTPAAATGGTYAITFTPTNTVGTGAAQAFTLTVNEAPTITSANQTTFTAGQAASFTLTTTGFPTGAAMTITQTGTLPAGVAFTDNGNGTAILAGTPTAGGTFPLTLTAANGVAPNATQAFTLTVQQAPAITSANATTFTLGVAGSFTMTTTGVPAATLTATGALPSGVTFTDDGDGTATLAGMPAAGTAGTYPLTFTATNAAGSTDQAFTLTVLDPRPTITAGGTLNYTEGNPATSIDTGIVVTDADSANLAAATVQILPPNYVSGQDVLGFSTMFGITGVFTPATGTLTLTGSATVANYQTALRSVTYVNTSVTPSILPRTVSWTVSDGTLTSLPAASTITVSAVNSTPMGGADAWTTFGNTELVVDQAGPTTPFVADTTPSTFGVLDNDTDPEGDARVVTGIVGCADTSAPFVCPTTAGGSVTMETNGRYTYRPQVGDTGADRCFPAASASPSPARPSAMKSTFHQAPRSSASGG